MTSVAFLAVKLIYMFSKRGCNPSVLQCKCSPRTSLQGQTISPTSPTTIGGGTAGTRANPGLINQRFTGPCAELVNIQSWGHTSVVGMFTSELGYPGCSIWIWSPGVSMQCRHGSLCLSPLTRKAFAYSAVNGRWMSTQRPIHPILNCL